MNSYQYAPASSSPATINPAQFASPALAPNANANAARTGINPSVLLSQQAQSQSQGQGQGQGRGTPSPEHAQMIYAQRQSGFNPQPSSPFYSGSAPMGPPQQIPQRPATAMSMSMAMGPGGMYSHPAHQTFNQHQHNMGVVNPMSMSSMTNMGVNNNNNNNINPLSVNSPSTPMSPIGSIGAMANMGQYNSPNPNAQSQNLNPQGSNLYPTNHGHAHGGHAHAQGLGLGANMGMGGLGFGIQRPPTAAGVFNSRPAANANTNANNSASNPNPNSTPNPNIRPPSRPHTAGSSHSVHSVHSATGSNSGSGSGSGVNSQQTQQQQSPIVPQQQQQQQQQQQSSNTQQPSGSNSTVQRTGSPFLSRRESRESLSQHGMGMGMARVGSPFVVPNQGAGQSLSDGPSQALNQNQPGVGGDRSSTPASAQGQMNQQRTMNGANPYNTSASGGGGMGPGLGLAMGNNPSQLNTGFGQQQQSQIHPVQPPNSAHNPSHPSHNPPTNPPHQNPPSNPAHPPPTSNMPPLTPYQQQQMHSLQNLTPQQIQAFTPQQQMQIQQLQMQMQMHAGGGGGGGGQRLGMQHMGQVQGQGQMGQMGQGQVGQGQVGQIGQEYQQAQAQRLGMGGVGMGGGGQQQEQMQQSQMQQREYQQQQQQQQQRQLEERRALENQSQNQQRQREERMIAFGAGTGAGAGGVSAGGAGNIGAQMQSVPSQNVISNPGAGQHGQQHNQQQFNPGSGQTMGHAQIGIGQQLGQGQMGQGQMGQMGQGQMGQGQGQMGQGQMGQMNPSQMSQMSQLSQMNQMNPISQMSQMTKPGTPSRPGTSSGIGGGGVVHNGPIGAGSIGVGGSIASPGGPGGVGGAGVMDLGRGMMSPQHTQHPSHPSHPSHMQQQQQPQHAQMSMSMSPVNLGPGGNNMNNMGNMGGMGGMGGMSGMGNMGTMGGMGGGMGSMGTMNSMSGMSNMNMVNLGGGAGVGVGGNRSGSVHSPVSMHRPSSSSGHPGAHPGLGTGAGVGAGMNMNMNMHANSSSSAGAGTMGGHPAATHQQSHSNQHTAHPSAPHTPHPSQQASNQGAHPHAHSSQPPHQNQHPNSNNQNPNNQNNPNPNNPAIPDSTTRITSVPLAQSLKLIPTLSASEIADIKIWMKRDKAYEGVYRGMMGRMRAELLGGGGGPGSGSGSGSPSGGGGGSRPAGIRERRWWERDVEAQTQQQQQQQRHGMHPHPHPHAQDLPIVNNIPRRKEPFKIIYPRASTLSRDAASSSSSSSRNRLVRRRDGVRLPLINSRSGVRRGGKAGGDLKDLLVPVRLEFDVEHYRFRDTFVWNLNDPVVTPEHFAQTLVEDYGLAQNFHSLITKSIQEQLSDYRAHSSMSFFADANDSPPPSATSTTANAKALTNGSAAQNGAEGDIAPLRCGVLSKDDELWWDAWRKRLRNKRGAVRAFETVSGEAEEARRKKRKVGAVDVPAEEGKAKKSILGEPMLLDDVFMESNFGLLEENHREEMRILIKLDITVGSVKLDDQFEWDLDNGDTTPEEFAEVYGNDLGLVGEFKTAIAHSIREQVHTYRKSLFLVGHPADGSAVQDEDLKSSLLSPVLSVARLPDQTGSYTPTLNYLSDGELDRIDKEREKELNKRRKRNTRGRRGLMLPDREPLKTHRTPAIGFPPMDSSLLAIAAAAAAPTSRRAAAAAATVNIAQMVASENGTSIIPTTPVPVVPQVSTPITSKLPKPRGSFKPPSYSSSVLKARAKVAAPTPSTSADASTFEPPLDGDLPLPSVAVAATPDLRAAKVISARRQRELEKEAKEKEFADGQHANVIDGVWHCSNCGCPESIAIGRRKGPLGDKSQCGACGKFWHRHRRPRPVEYHTEVEYHLNLKLEAERGKTPSKKRGAAGRVANTETREATPVRGSAAPPEPDNKAAFLKPDASPDNKVSRRSRGPSSEPPERPISRASSSTSSTSERPLAQAVLVNGVSHKPSSSKSDIKVEEPAIENQPPPETQAPVPENMEPSEESTENKPDNIETSSQEPPPPPPVAANPPPTSTPPARPKWLEDAIAEILTRYPDDRMDVIMRRVSSDAPPDWRIRCLDCPGKLYIHGPGETLNGYEVHLRNRQHRSRVNARVNGTAQNTT